MSDLPDVDISRERIEHLRSFGSIDYIHLAMIDEIDRLRAQQTVLVAALTSLRDRLWDTAEGLLESARQASVEGDADGDMDYCRRAAWFMEQYEIARKALATLDVPDSSEGE